MKNILLPTDFSDNAWNAIKYALELFKKSTCTLHITHINEFMAYTEPRTTFITTPRLLEESSYQESLENLAKLMEKIEDLPTNTNHTFKTSAIQSFFTDSIKKQVVEKNIDLIVMGTKGASGLKEMTMGSNTGDVITKVKCPVLAVPENTTYNGLKEIAFPTSYHLGYEIKVLDDLKEMVTINHSALRFLYVTSNGGELSREQMKNQTLLKNYFSSIKHTFHTVNGQKLETAVQRFTESSGVDMIVMVAKNLNLLQRILFRPAVEKISYHSDIPFLVLHE